MEAKDIKWCPQHGYPLPCDKCGLGLYEAGFEAGRQEGRKEVVEFLKPRLDKISELVGNIRGDWTDPRSDCREIWDILAEIEAKLKEWGIEDG